MSSIPSDSTSRAIPLLGDLSLEYVQQIEHKLDGGFVAMRIVNLPGELQQRSGRPSHQMRIRGLLFSEQGREQLAKLQEQAASGEELNFAADITSALDLQKAVITSFHALESAGQPGRFHYTVALRESPPLPPPAQVEGFGGLDDFGLGDLGFDTDILGDIGDLASEVASAVNGALDVVDKLGALASLADGGGLELGSFMQPVDDVVDKVSDLASRLSDSTRRLGDLFSS